MNMCHYYIMTLKEQEHLPVIYNDIKIIQEHVPVFNNDIDTVGTGTGI